VKQLPVREIASMFLEVNFLREYISRIKKYWMGLKYLSGLNDIPVEAINDCWQQGLCQRY
jgi:hypothetical protein